MHYTYISLLTHFFPTSQLHNQQNWILKKISVCLSKNKTSTFEQGCQSPEPLYHYFMYSLISLLSGIYPLPAMHSLLVTINQIYPLPAMHSLLVTINQILTIARSLNLVLNYFYLWNTDLEKGLVPLPPPPLSLPFNQNLVER